MLEVVAAMDEWAKCGAGQRPARTLRCPVRDNVGCMDKHWIAIARCSLGVENSPLLCNGVRAVKNRPV